MRFCRALAPRYGVSVCTLVALALAGRVRAQEIPNSEPFTVWVHPERKLVVAAPETILTHTIVGEPRFAVIASDTSLDIFPHADFRPPMVAVLHVIGERHEWTVILKAVDQPELVREQIELVVVSPRAEVAGASAARLSAPPAQAANDNRSDDDAIRVSLQGLTGRGVTWLRPSQQSAMASQSHTTLGMRFSAARPNAWWTGELQLTWNWLDRPLMYEVEGSDDSRSQTPAWAQSALLFRGRSRGKVALSYFVGMGAQMRAKGQLVMGDQHTTRASSPLEGIALAGLGIDYRTDDLSLGLELVGTFGMPDDFTSLALVLYVGAPAPKRRE
ncbi:hypothetical protein Hoch_2120 [Haliangium ochraceum DSM 14365]|uniref:Uncharacterized protein n=1 Tax=Haliangium ochraceum (strain DSM 14365 / JCM 11303 / SMP-2) TaxID=502025 RepID=D0LGU3_HALO1|nr:hypothetical protein Hoch_2120 [Haliangium ochraceum DSM 14365]